MAKFVLILYGAPNYFQDASPEEMQRIFEKVQSWMDKFRSAGRYVTSDKLQDD